MNAPEYAFSNDNATLSSDLEAYEKRMISTANSVDDVEEVVFSLSDTDAGWGLEEYERKMLSGQMRISHDYDYDVMEESYDTVPVSDYGGENIFSRFQSVDYFDWPNKFGKGDSQYDQQAVAWIKANRAAVTDFPGLSKVKYKSTEPNGFNYNGHPTTDPAPNWGLTVATQAPVYEGIRKELFGEGGASSINTYDDQILTVGWGFSVKNEMGRSVLFYNMQASAAYKEKILSVGMSVDAATVYYLDTDKPAVLTGDAALKKIKWDQKVLSQLIIAAESVMNINIDSQVKVFKQFRMKDFPAEGFQWPVDSVRLAVHLKHWLPVGINWGTLKGSGGNVAAIVKSFCKNIYDYQEKNKKTDYFLHISKLPNNALFVDDKDGRFHIGNDSLVKAGAAKTIPTVSPGGFTDTFKTGAQYAGYVFVAHKGTIYILA